MLIAILKLVISLNGLDADAEYPTEQIMTADGVDYLVTCEVRKSDHNEIATGCDVVPAEEVY